MDQIQAYWPFILMVLNGIIAGWIAGQILGGGGLLRNLIVGIIGAVLGGALVKSGLLTLPASVNQITGGNAHMNQIIVSTIGAMIVVLIARFLGRR
jgi:uncharacterized membrane protein YeaQ/YmgE (transglycosylase-associated protein family)